jgi:hypothetical protein
MSDLLGALLGGGLAAWGMTYLLYHPREIWPAVLI